MAKFQVHSAFTNLLLLLALLLAVFFSLDYDRPIVQRSYEVIIYLRFEFWPLLGPLKAPEISCRS